MAMRSLGKSFVSRVLLYWGGIRFLSALRGPAAVILSYHRINRLTFEPQLALLARHCQFLSLEEYVDWLSGRRRLRRPGVVVTIDDGYRDSYEVAFPLLRRFGIPAVVFPIVGLVGTDGLPWWDRVERALTALAGEAVQLNGRRAVLEGAMLNGALQGVLAMLKGMRDEDKWALVDEFEAKAGSLPPRPRAMLSWEEAREMADGGILFGSHTLSHPILSRTTEVQAWREIRDSKLLLEEAIGRPVRFFAYPNGLPGDYLEIHLRMLAKAGYLGAVSNFTGFNRHGHDLYALARRSMDRGSLARLSLALSGFAGRKRGQ